MARGKHVHLTLEPELVVHIDRLAAEKGVSRAAMIHHLVRWAVVAVIEHRSSG